MHLSCPRPCPAGSHAPGQIFECLRSYLHYEWHRKAREGPPDCVPRLYEEERNRAQTAVVMGTPGSVVVPPEPHFNKGTLSGFRMTDELPRQDNHVDCGLFLLSYLEFFAVGNPSAIEQQGGNARGECVSRATCAYAGYSFVARLDRQSSQFRGPA